MSTVRSTDRTLLGTAIAAGLWTAPAVVAVTAAPALASSGATACATGSYVMRWSDHYDARTRQAAPLLTSAGVGRNANDPLSLSITSSFAGSMVSGSAPDGASNLTVSPFNVGGTGRRGLTLMQRSSGTRLLGTLSDHFQRVTLTFGRPVSNLKFTITDIDSFSGQYQDRVFVSGSPAGTKPSPTLLTGAGSSGSPWRSTGTDNNLPSTTDSRGNVTVDYTGQPASATYTITFWNAQTNSRRTPLTGNGLQGIFLTDLSFNASTCA